VSKKNLPEQLYLTCVMLNEAYVQQITGPFFPGFDQGDMGIFLVLWMIMCTVAGIKSSIQWKKSL